MRTTIGAWVMALAVLHTVVGLIMGWPHLAAILADGWFASVPDDAPMRMAVFWFLWFGGGLFLVGAAWRQLETTGGHIPRWQGIGLGLVALLGAMAIPVSGFWLALPLAGAVVVRSP